MQKLKFLKSTVYLQQEKLSKQDHRRQRQNWFFLNGTPCILAYLNACLNLTILEKNLPQLNYYI